MAAPDDFASKPIVYRTHGMESVRVRSNIVYTATEEGPLALDLYLPPGLRLGERRPVVVFVYGDGPPRVLRDAKTWGAFVSWGRLVAASGLAGITFDHRSTDLRRKLPEAAGDVENLLSYVRAHASELSIDPDRIGLWVCSMAPPIALYGLLPDPPEFLRCVVSYYGAMDLIPVRGDTPSEVPDRVLEDFSPARRLLRSAGPLPPILLARAGREERPWLNATIDRFAATAIGRGAELDLLVHPTGRHAFDILDDDPRSKEIIAHTVEFLRLRLLGQQEPVRGEPPRAQDMLRHLDDLRSGTFEGAVDRSDRLRLFDGAVELIDPVVRAVLDETSEVFLGGTGAVELQPPRVDARGDSEARWVLSWPEQRAATNVRAGGTVQPVQVVAWFAAGFTHPHLRGSRAGNWPLQVLTEQDARRQEPIVRAIVEAEIHERIFEGTWKVIPRWDKKDESTA